MVVISLRELQRCEMITGVTLAIISTLGYRCHRDAIYSTLITGDVHHFSGKGSGFVVTIVQD